MIFTELVLNNFGIYKGHHAINLRPVDSTRPIILLGGLNGGGKTTLLDALQLVLYGKFARCSKRGRLPYKDYLSQTINHHVVPTDGAFLELSFLNFEDGEQVNYRIRRFWRLKVKNVVETMEVFRDGRLDPVMSEQWYGYVEDFIPNNIARLFFFDGEHIESLADPETSAAIIQTGVNSLLGLDYVDKLKNDLEVVKRRRLTAQTGGAEKEKITQLEQAIDGLDRKISSLKMRVAQKRTEIDVVNRQIAATQKDYILHGGALYEERELIQAKHQYAIEAVKADEEQMRNFVEGAAPLVLVMPLMQRVKEKAEAEADIQLNRLLSAILESRDIEIVEQFRYVTQKTESVETLKQLLAAERKARAVSAQRATTLNIPPEAFKGIDTAFFVSIKRRANSLLQNHNARIARMLESEQRLAAVPAEELIQDIAHQLRSFEANKKDLEGKLKALEDELEELNRALALKNGELDRALHSSNDRSQNADRNQRVLKQVHLVQDTLVRYRRSFVQQHIGLLEDLIKESFHSLVRKKDLVRRISIDPDDFSLRIINFVNDSFSAKVLSAGERQLLAISILWGLAKASRRPIPAIIDTPLGRLDSGHRAQLVENYFPNLSHQVILLSTDTEIDRRYRDSLAPAIGKEYRIQYCPAGQTSRVTPGYF